MGSVFVVVHERVMVSPHVCSYGNSAAMLKRGMLAFIVAVVLDSGEDLAHGDGELMVRLRLLALGAMSAQMMSSMLTVP